MRFLFAIPHFYDSQQSPGNNRHGSTVQPPEVRRESLERCVLSLHQLFGSAQCIMQLAQNKTEAANQRLRGEVHVVLCTTLEQHLIEQLRLDSRLYVHHRTRTEPPFLGYECQAVLRDRWGSYDYYCYLEDDLLLHDNWLFQKLKWFNQHVGEESLLLPNRFEQAAGMLAHRAYVDGDLREEVTAPYQDVHQRAELASQVLGAEIRFRRPLNPHAGCYFLNGSQMQHWMRQPYFLDRSRAFIGPLESAATLGIMRAFRIYKPAPENASFLEIEHQGNGFIRQLRSPEST